MKNQKKALILNLTILILSGIAGAAEHINFDIVPEDIKMSSKDLHFIVPKGLHFNSDAPNKAEAMIKGKWQTSTKIEIHGAILMVNWGRAIDPCLGIKAELFICDDKNTFCLPRSQVFKCINGKFVSAPSRPSESNSKLPAQKPSHMETHFISNDSEQALALARETHRPLLIEFFGIWCPPCNELNETVFNTEEFVNLSDQFVLLKLDADLGASWKLKSKFNITGYPTVVFATESGDEISRIVGYRPKTEFVSLMSKALKNKDNSIETKKIKAETNDAAAYELGSLYLEKEQYYLANYYLLKASRHWTLPDIRRNKLMSAQLGLHSKADSVEDKKVYEKLLVHALEWYPRQPEVFDRSEALIGLSEEVGDKDLTQLAYKNQIETAKWYLNHPKALKGTDILNGDLYEILGGAYEATDDKQLSLDAYSDGAKEYLREIKRAGLDENSERGYNLERIYCLWKSGQIDLAQNLYESFEKQFPKEFTFYYQHAKLLEALKNLKEAEEKGLKAYEFSYGDNRLRVAGLLADVYQKQNDKEKAIKILEKAMAEFSLPDDKSIRSHRYYNKLAELRKKIKEG